MRASPARSRRTRCWPRSATSSASRSAASARCSRPSPRGGAAAGVVPIENVINGTVRENYDLLLEHDLEIRGEVVVPVSLCLAALPGQRLEDIERVYSHIQALGQAEAFLRAPAVAAADDLQHGRRRQGDRGSGRTRRRGGAVAPGGRPVRARGPGRRDRRPARQPDPVRRPRPAGRASRRLPVATGTRRRTTLVVAVRNEPGTLLAVLQVFAGHGLNMHKLESRPSRERAWEYVFWIDLDGDADGPGDGGRPRRARRGDHDVPRPRATRRRPRAPRGGAERRSGRAPAQARRGSRSGGPPRPTDRPAAPP